MTELLSAAQMRAIEAAAIASGDVTGLELMERAGQGVVAAVYEEWPELARGASAGGCLPPKPGSLEPLALNRDLPREYLGQDERALRAVVLCGPGNNGGDGFVIARLLLARGWEVDVFLHGDAARLPADARENYQRWLHLGSVTALTEAAVRVPHPVHSDAYADLYIDAIFGTGLSRPPEGEMAGVLRHLGRSGGEAYLRLVAVDAPSGLCLDSGRMLLQGRAVPRAALTVTFDSPKIGHYLADGPECCGKLVVADIGLREWRETEAREIPKRAADGAGAERPSGSAFQIRPHRLVLIDDRKLVEDSRPFIAFEPQVLRKRPGHKFTHGRALVLSGPAGRGGAARMTARGALRIGTGLVTLICPAEALAEHAARLDAVMVQPVAGARDLQDVLRDPRITALCLGPALGKGEREAGLLAASLADPARKLVLDADALTILSRHRDLVSALHSNCVLTPHLGEFARLFPEIAAKLAEPPKKGPAYSKLEACREAAALAGCVVLLKGPDTVIAEPSGRAAGRAAVHSAAYDRAAPWLATAGAGDVLAGFICGLMARGFDPFDAACASAWLHVECALSFGPGLIAEDLPEELPKVLRALEMG